VKLVVYEIRIALAGTDPLVWRRIRVPADARLSLVHYAIQVAMGWYNSHLHEFVGKDGARYGMAEDGNAYGGVLDERRYQLTALLAEQGDSCLYVYDFGDDWVHELVLESVVELSDDEFPVCCLDGSGACPPEDCGGVPGYAELLECLRDRSSKRHDAAVDFLGEDFDAEAFDCVPFNERSRKLFTRDAVSHPVPEESPGLLEDLLLFLGSDGMPESVMSVMCLHGFFSALAIYPLTITADLWLPLVWDVTGDGMEPEFSSFEEVKKGMGLVYAYHNSVVRQLSEKPEEYVPLYELVDFESDKEEELAVRDWAFGFILGAMIDKGVFERTFSDRDTHLLLAPMVMLAGMHDDIEGLPEDEQVVLMEELPGELGDYVLDLQGFWEPWRKEYLAGLGKDRTVRTTVRVGRNDKCPCGSGKKYKKCCGK